MRGVEEYLFSTCAEPEQINEASLLILHFTRGKRNPDAICFHSRQYFKKQMSYIQILTEKHLNSKALCCGLCSQSSTFL